MKKIFLICSLLFTSFNNYADSPVWEIEKNGHKTYLAGTIHLLRPSDYPLPKAFDAAYKKSSIIVFETDLQALKSPSFSSKLLASVQLDKSQHLLQFLTPDTQKKLQDYCIKNNIQLSNLSRFKPSFVALTLALTELRKMGVSQTGVDEYFNQRAIKDQKVILGLETPEQQIQFLSQMGAGYENEFILQTFEDIKDINRLFNDMVLSWRKGNLKQIESFFIEPTKKQFPMMHQQILVNRNNAWLPQIKHFLATPDTEMIMVGSAHLAGQDGLLKMLKDAGYKTTQLY